jgi:hypothetical protein
MRHRAIVLLSITALAPAAGFAQGSICNPCVDPPTISRGNFTNPDGTTVITGTDMRALGVVSVADMINLLPGNAGLVNVPAPVEAALAGPVHETDYFVISGAFAGLSVPIEELGSEFDKAYEVVSERMGLDVAVVSSRTLERKIPLLVTLPEGTGQALGCPQRGRASASHIEIFADSATPEVQLLGVTAHEIGHVLTFTWLGINPWAGLMPNEGVATWAASDYMTKWYGIASLEAGAARIVADGRYASVSEPVGPFYTVPAEPDATAPTTDECLARRDRLYTEWGAFFGYLVAEHGQESLRRLLLSSSGFPLTELSFRPRESNDTEPASPVTIASVPAPDPVRLDYEGVYGIGLRELEAAWLDSLPGDR